jgi:hypothetical protein
VIGESVFRVVKEWDVVRVRVTEEGRKRIERLLAENRCLGCEEPFADGEKVCCGQCTTCYPASMKGIRNHKVSRNNLIREGKMLSPGPPGPKPKNNYTRELSGR